MRFVMALIVFAAASPVPADEIQFPADQIAAGKGLYLKKCRQCHGRDALGGNAPDIQGILLKDVLEASEGVENMPKIVLTAPEAEDLAIYLMSLAPDQARARLGQN